jgi:hypothetical protein
MGFLQELDPLILNKDVQGFGMGVYVVIWTEVLNEMLDLIDTVYLENLLLILF